MILVTGSGGMMASHLADVYDEELLYRTDLRGNLEEGVQAMDIKDRDQVMSTIERVRPRQVIHMGAETDVDRCERDPDHAYRNNTLGTLNIALACQRFDAELVYVSTAGVFDGNKPEPYTEFDAPGPVSVYARSKLEGEKIVQSLLPRHYVVRAGWMFGGKGKDKKFVGKMASLCMTEGQIKVVNDKFGNPTYAKDLLANLKLLTSQGLYGLYHLVGEGSCSRYDVAREVAAYLGRDLEIVPVNSASFPLPAPRPRSEAARAYKLDLLGLNRMRPWKLALHDYLRDWSRVLSPAMAGQ
jgi:dTDP-4-dehydrorhamnose reductase